MECRDCAGTGTTQAQRSRWIGGGRNGYRSTWFVTVTCERCEGTGIDPDPSPAAGTFTYYGAPVVAPGFDADTFRAALSRARTRATMPMIPAGAGVVLVESARNGARYRVTRHTCSCPGHASHGHCMHRAAVVACADLYGVDVCHTHLLGFDPAGHPVTAAARLAQMEGAA